MCKTCYEEKHYPEEELDHAVDQEMEDEEKNGDGSAEVTTVRRKQTRFEEKSLDKDYWERVEKDLKVQQDQPAQCKKTSNLSPADQQKLLKLVLQNGVDAWKIISDELNLKSAKEAVFEFLRIEDKTVLDVNKYLLDHAKDLNDEDGDEINVSEIQQKFTDIEPYSQVDQLFLQCNLLSKFSEDTEVAQPLKEIEDQPERQRDKKLKRKLAQKCLLAEFKSIQSQLKHLVQRDNGLAKVRNDLRNMQSQLFAERVSMSVSAMKKQREAN